jgi:hypothetical protein
MFLNNSLFTKNLHNCAKEALIQFSTNSELGLGALTQPSRRRQAFMHSRRVVFVLGQISQQQPGAAALGGGQGGGVGGLL